jgi:hypothetical protein
MFIEKAFRILYFPYSVNGESSSYFVFHLQSLCRKLFVFCISLLVFLGKAFRILYFTYKDYGESFAYLYFTYNVYGESFTYFVFHLQCLWRKLFVFCISLTMFMEKALCILYFTYNVYVESFSDFVFHF